ncbi:oxidoreductase [Multifurca ochricompacta]|uniref:Oxidoreductase n=1 Tax=Multifurca ochricompacta TaxID=376703 RepID=A0AAD4QT50_9AGAM|nr:oxidoreductase [Multifurca ochricompacta]
MDMLDFSLTILVLVLLILVLVLLISTIVTTMVWPFSSRPRWNPGGRHCYITGGSSGLGLSLAILLTKRGADVSIVARNEANLQKALKQLEAARINPNQVLKAYSFSLGTQEAAADALDAACVPHGGRTPDAVFLCAGKSTPGFFIEQTEESMRKGMDETYWLAAWSAMAATKRMVHTRSKGKIVFISSVLGYFGMIGYSTYSPGKHAIRGLAETLRQELLLYSVEVQIYLPVTMYSPGYEEENKSKPELVLKIEESDSGLTPEKAAEGLYEGMQRGDFHITDTLIANVFRTSTRGASPFGSSVLKDLLFSLIGTIALPFWRKDVDRQVVGHRKAHLEYLASKGILAVE